uniref:Agglutinin domain-containing protein n=1 Tax=Cucumis sativus TaxID=3659 RepID=A0A0A0KA25_CUCSA
MNLSRGRRKAGTDNLEGADEAEKKLMKSDYKDGLMLNQGQVIEDEKLKKVIPKNLFLKSIRNGKYLRYISKGENADGLLQYSSKNMVGPYSKFVLHGSKTKPGFFHIRCCYNNKFWVRLSEDSNYIAAKANEEEDDTSKWSCTLFEPIIFAPDRTELYYIRHVQLNTFLFMAEGDPSPYNDCLVAREEDMRTTDKDLVLSVVTDWDSIFVLPKYIAFKSNNDRYLEPYRKYLKFSASSVEDPVIVFEIIPMQDGYVRIKHVSSGKYWILDPNWICCESIDINRDDPNTLFLPVKVDNNIRSVEDVEYRVKDARVYGKKIHSVSKGVAINNTKVDDKVSMKFSYERVVERTWSSSMSSTFGIATRFNAMIPGVGRMKFELSMEASSASARQETEKEKSMVETEETITIPAMSKVKFSAVVTHAYCDVPFSYTRRDTLKDGRQVTHRFEDGLFTGVTTYDYKFETEKVESYSD